MYLAHEKVTAQHMRNYVEDIIYVKKSILSLTNSALAFK